MSASLIVGQNARRICAMIVFLLSSTTSAFTKVSSSRITGRSCGSASFAENSFQTRRLPCNLEKSSPSRGYSPLYSTPIIDTSIEESNGNSTTNIVVPAVGFFSKLKNLLSGDGFGKLPINKESISKLGLNVLLAYGLVSNFSYITCLILAWVAHGKSTRLSPLVPGQWKKFLLVYAGFFAANNVLRPLRFSLSLAITPLFDKFIDFIEAKTSWSRRNCTALVVFIVNILGTFTYLFAGLFIATTIANVPLLP